MADSKKPSLAMVLGAGEPASEPDEDDDGGYSAAVGELADVLGVPDDKLDAFKSAFQAAVMSCQ